MEFPMAQPDYMFDPSPPVLVTALHNASEYIHDAQMAPADGLTVSQAAHVSLALSAMERKAHEIRRILAEMA